MTKFKVYQTVPTIMSYCYYVEANSPEEALALCEDDNFKLPPDETRVEEEFHDEDSGYSVFWEVDKSDQE